MSKEPAKGEDGGVEVGYIVAQPSRIATTRTYAGRITAFQSADVRPQVTGLIIKRLFTEGQSVKAGQPLYQIDPSLYVASVNQARADLWRAQAAQSAADERTRRYRPLAEINAVSRQDLVDAQAASRQAAASVAQARAALNAAQTSLRFSTVPAPLSGRIGRSLVTEGGLATAHQAEPLAVIEQLDPIFVDVQQSTAELAALRNSIANKTAQAGKTKAQILLPDGSIYPIPGTIEFSEALVDPSTGTVNLRIRVPNPQATLLPGAFVRASFAQSTIPSAFLVPQEALSRNAAGEGIVWVVGPNNTAIQRIVLAPRTEGRNWVIIQGLYPGDRIITQGTSKLRPDAHIRPVPASTPEQIGPATGPADIKKR